MLNTVTEVLKEFKFKKKKKKKDSKNTKTTLTALWPTHVVLGIHSLRQRGQCGCIIGLNQ